LKTRKVSRYIEKRGRIILETKPDYGTGVIKPCWIFEKIFPTSGPNNEGPSKLKTTRQQQHRSKRTATTIRMMIQGFVFLAGVAGDA
jgi:hypothetical protein